MSSENESMPSTSGVKPKISNNSQPKANNLNHASTSGTSSALSEIANNSQPKANQPTSTRLTSFLGPRDLTLGANSSKAEKTKKVYTPNLNAQRKKKEDEPAAVQKNAKTPRNKRKGKGHERGNKHKANLMQTTGVFSEGLAESRNSRPRSGYSGFRESSDRAESKEPLRRLKLNTGRQVNKEEEDQKLQMLLRDDFVEEDHEVDQNNPIVLPIIKEGKLLKENGDVKIKVEVDEEGTSSVVNNVKTKRIHNANFQDDKDFDKKFPLNVSQSLENPNGYLVISFPDVLPGITNDPEEDQPKPIKGVLPQVETKKPKIGTQPLLDNLQEGLLGKLEILKSGAARLCLGNNKLVVELGPRVFYREDVMAVKLGNERPSGELGELINLGPVHTSLCCTPDWESLT